MYECKRCGYTTHLFYNFNRHQTRKIPCKAKICQIVTDDGNEEPSTLLINHSTNVTNASNVENNSVNVSELLTTFTGAHLNVEQAPVDVQHAPTDVIKTQNVSHTIYGINLISTLTAFLKK